MNKSLEDDNLIEYYIDEIIDKKNLINELLNTIKIKKKTKLDIEQEYQLLLDYIVKLKELILLEKYKNIINELNKVIQTHEADLIKIREEIDKKLMSFCTIDKNIISEKELIEKKKNKKKKLKFKNEAIENEILSDLFKNEDEIHESVNVGITFNTNFL